ncbi:MAG TPA: inositol oxygenase family protein [Abditibacteriaceae bacterium]|jgi:inositol oxygenase
MEATSAFKPPEHTPQEHTPLENLEHWEEFMLLRYPQQGQAADAQKDKDAYRNYDNPARDTVREFYRLNHKHQTYDFVLHKEKEFLRLERKSITPWEALEYLNTLVDDSDPDIELSQWEHLLQTSEAIRADGHPDWFVLTGLIHDLGKILCLFGEPQWAVVGDTFPVGCRFSERIVYPEFFAHNPDSAVPEFQTRCGIYDENCGLDKVHLSWGHDEYLYHIMKEYLPEPALYMIRYHSFYAAHREGEYQHLMNEHDRKMFRWVQAFNPYDLYSKCPEPLHWRELRPYYQDLLTKYLPHSLRF